MEPTQGTRRDWTDGLLQPGEYGKFSVDGEWYGVPPNHPNLLAGLAKHDVVEHEDGTITVSPSILVKAGRNGVEWHGYLERGVWREV
jgi:hypothetical protein